MFRYAAADPVWCPMRLRSSFVGLFFVFMALSASGSFSREQSSSRAQANNQELERLFRDDQGDPRANRTADDAAATSARAKGRREKLALLLASGGVVTAEDYYRAALLYQHSDSSDDLLMAHVLATVSGFKGNYMGRWLSAAALDKYLRWGGRPQIFGTQYFAAGNRQLNATFLSDTLRREFCVPILAQQEQNNAIAIKGGRSWTRILPACEPGFVPGGKIPKP